MATIFNDWEYQMRLGRIASGASAMVWSDACGYFEVPNPQVALQAYGSHNTVSVNLISPLSSFVNYIGSSYSPYSYDPYSYTPASPPTNYGYYIQPSDCEGVVYGGTLEDNRVVDGTIQCPDCKGSGTYVGLLHQGDCRKCGGSGEV